MSVEITRYEHDDESMMTDVYESLMTVYLSKSQDDEKSQDDGSLMTGIDESLMTVCL